MTEAYTSARTDEAKKRLALLLQQPAEIEAILSGWWSGENIQGLIRSKGNIMPEYREEQEADIAIGMERRIIARRIWKITFPPAWHFREKSKKSIERVQGIIREQMQKYYDLDGKRWIENFEISSNGKQVSGTYLWVSFYITLLGWGKVKIQTQDEDFESIEAFRETVQKSLFQKIRFPFLYSIMVKRYVNFYKITQEFQDFLKNTCFKQMWQNPYIFFLSEWIVTCFEEWSIGKFLNHTITTEETVVISEDDFYCMIYQYLKQTEIAG